MKSFILVVEGDGKEEGGEEGDEEEEDASKNCYACTCINRFNNNVNSL